MAGFCSIVNASVMPRSKVHNARHSSGLDLGNDTLGLVTNILVIFSTSRAVKKVHIVKANNKKTNKAGSLFVRNADNQSLAERRQVKALKPYYYYYYY